MRREEPSKDAEVGLPKTNSEDEVPLLGNPKEEKIKRDVNVVTVDETIKTKYPEKRRSSLTKIEYGKVLQEIQAKVTPKSKVGPAGIGYLVKKLKNKCRYLNSTLFQRH